MTTGGGEGGRRLAADLEQDPARPLAWGASPPGCSRSAQPAWGASRGPSLIRRGGEKEGEREREGSFFFRLRESFSVLLHRLEGKRRREKKRTSRPPLPLFRGTPDLLVDNEIASFWMRE
jgi:hypothetical protein